MNADAEIPAGAIAFVRDASGARVWLYAALGGYAVSLERPAWFGSLQFALAVLLMQEP